MDVNLVSYSQWQTVYIWATNHGYGFKNAGAGKAANHPVQTVDWYDVVKWCNARSQQAGLTPVYYTDAGLTQVYTNGDSGIPTIYAEMGGQWLSVADGGGVGESGERRFERAKVSVGQRDFRKPGKLSRIRRLPGYDLGPNRLQSRLHKRRVSLHESGGIFCAKWLWTLRHGWKRMGVVLGFLYPVLCRGH